MYYPNHGRRGLHNSLGGVRPSDTHDMPVFSNNSGPEPSSSEDGWQKESTIMIGIDIGSTQSGVAFSFLQKGAKEQIYRVGRWPGQASDHQSKVPTLVWYDKSGKAMSFGAEALEDRDEAESNGWTLAKHFKLRLHTKEMLAESSIDLDPLPDGVSLHQIYADFMRYLIEHTKPIFEVQIWDGKAIWEQYYPNATFIIAHPNGWDIRQQQFLRRAAVEAGLVDSKTADNRIRFVTEAEASVHYCIRYSNIVNRIQPGISFAVCDAGGSTIDTTVYNVTAVNPILKLAEKRDSACVRAGGIFVDARAKEYLEQALAGVGTGATETKLYVEEGVKDFEAYGKRVFSNEALKTKIKLGNPSLQLRDKGISRGVLTIPGTITQQFFRQCISDIITSLDKQMVGMNVSQIMLVGGFGDSPHLQKRIEEHCGPLNCELTNVENSTSKAVAEGAVIWNTITSVFRRAPRWSYGIQGYTRFDPDRRDHRERTTFTAVDGYEKVTGIWCQIAKKGDPVDVDSVSRQRFVRTYGTSTPNLATFEIALYTYSGDDEPKWLRSDAGSRLDGFEEVCLITADLKSMSGALESRIGPNGTRFWGLLFYVCIQFGDTETRAYLEWEEKGKFRRGPIHMVAEPIGF